MKHLAFAVLTLCFLASCQSANPPQRAQTLATSTKVGSVKLQYGSALDQFRNVVAFDGGDVEKMYLEAQAAYERGTMRADSATYMIKRIDDSAQQVLAEWESELDHYNDPQRQADSKDRLEAARERHAKTMQDMRQAQAAMAPVLEQMNDLVLYLRHRLNAVALGEVPSNADELKRETDGYLKSLNKAIADADKFVGQLER